MVFIFQIGCFYWGPLKQQGLLFGYCLGHLLTGIIIFLWCLHQFSILKLKLSVRALKRALVFYKDFPLYTAPYTLQGQGFRHAFVVLIFNMVGVSASGLFAFINRVIAVPVGAFSQILSQVFLPSLSSREKIISQEKLILKILQITAFLIIPFLSIFVGFREEIITWVFGENWRASADIALIMLLPASLMFFIGWIERLYDALGKQKFQLKQELFFNILSVGGFCVSWFWQKNFLLSLSVYSAITAVYYIFWGYFLFRFLNFETKKFFNILFQYFLFQAIGIGLVCYLKSLV